MTNAPTRRAVLAGLSAAGLTVPALAALPAAASGHPDAELFRTVHEFEDAKVTWEMADRDEDNLYHLAWKDYPVPPPAIRASAITRGDGSSGFTTVVREIIEDGLRRAGDNEEVRQVWQARLSERDAYDAACSVIDERYGVPEAKARAQVARTKYTEAEGRVYQTPAKTADGIAAKLRVAIQEYEDCEFDVDTMALILADAERLGRTT